MEQLQALCFRPSGSLAEFEATPLCPQPPATTLAREAEASLRRWASAAAPLSPDAAPFGDIYTAVAAFGTPAAARLSSLWAPLAAALAGAAFEAARQLQAPLGGGADGPDAGNPRFRVAAANAFKLLLFFLCHLQRKATEQVRCASKCCISNSLCAWQARAAAPSTSTGKPFPR